MPIMDTYSKAIRTTFLEMATEPPAAQCFDALAFPAGVFEPVETSCEPAPSGATMADTSRPVDLRQSAYERGLIDGKNAEVSKIPPSAYAIVGIDDYARGFRAAYFGRELAPLVSADT